METHIYANHTHLLIVGAGYIREKSSKRCK